jgi:hypothetical protein
MELDGDALRFTAQGRLLASEALVGFLPERVAAAPVGPG